MIDIGSDALISEIDSFLCDWNRPSHLDTSDLLANVHKVAILIYKDREACPEHPSPRSTSWCWRTSAPRAIVTTILNAQPSRSRSALSALPSLSS